MDTSADKILESIKNEAKKNLSGLVGEQLQEVLKNYEDLKKNHEKLKDDNTDLQDRHHRLTKALEELEDKYLGLLKAAGDIEGREAAVAEAEKEVKVQKDILGIRQGHCEQRVSDHVNMVNLIFRNTTIQKKMHDSITLNDTDEHGCSTVHTDVRNCSVEETRD